MVERYVLLCVSVAIAGFLGMMLFLSAEDALLERRLRARDKRDGSHVRVDAKAPGATAQRDVDELPIA